MADMDHGGDTPRMHPVAPCCDCGQTVGITSPTYRGPTAAGVWPPWKGRYTAFYVKHMIRPGDPRQCSASDKAVPIAFMARCNWEKNR